MCAKVRSVASMRPLRTTRTAKRGGSAAEAQLRPRRAELRVEWLDASEDCAEWDELAERLGNVFATSAWAAAWWRRWGGDTRALIAAWRRTDGALAGVLPLYLASERPLRVLRFIGHGAGDLLGRGAPLRTVATSPSPCTGSLTIAASRGMCSSPSRLPLAIGGLARSEAVFSAARPVLSCD